MLIRNAGTTASSGGHRSLEVTDEWVSNTNKGWPQSKSTTLAPSPGAVKMGADLASVHAEPA